MMGVLFKFAGDEYAWSSVCVQCYSASHQHGADTLLLSSQTVCIHMMTVDSCFSFNKIRLKKLVVHSLICHLTEGATWGLPYPIHSEWLIRDGLIHTGWAQHSEAAPLHKPINGWSPSQKETCLVSCIRASVVISRSFSSVLIVFE